jgi:hypothetical protein
MARGPFSKQDVARAQINTAISLFVENKDFVSANTLAWASSDLLRGIAEHRGIITFQEELETRIRPDFIPEWRRLLRAAYTFSKHADRDPEEQLDELDPEATCYGIFGAAINYSRVFGQKTIQMFVFQNWFYARYPDVAAEEFKVVAAALSNVFGPNINGPLENATELVGEIIETCILHEGSVRQKLGGTWSRALEPF